MSLLSYRSGLMAARYIQYSTRSCLGIINSSTPSTPFIRNFSTKAEDESVIKTEKTDQQVDPDKVKKIRYRDIMRLNDQMKIELSFLERFFLFFSREYKSFSEVPRYISNRDDQRQCSKARIWLNVTIFIVIHLILLGVAIRGKYFL